MIVAQRTFHSSRGFLNPLTLRARRPSTDTRFLGNSAKRVGAA